MTDRLAAMGSVDQIRDVLNPPFEMIVNTVHRHFGSVIKLAGDSAIVAWTIPPKLTANLMLEHQIRNSEAETRAKENICRLALLCCMELLEQFDDYVVQIKGNSFKPNSQSLDIDENDFRRVSTNSKKQFLSWSRKGSRMDTSESFGHRKETVKDVEESEHVQKLSLHIGLGFGDIHHVFVGSSPKVNQNTSEAKPSPCRSEYFISGRALYDAGIMLSRGTSGTLVFDQKDMSITTVERDLLYQFIDKSSGLVFLQFTSKNDDDSDLERLRNGLESHLPPRKLLGKGEGIFLLDERACKSDQRLLAFIEPSLKKSLLRQHDALYSSGQSLNDGGFSDNLNQFRTITVLFTHFPNIPIDRLGISPRILSDVNFIAEETIGAAAEYGGTCRQIHADEKGLSVLLLWGVAGFSHEKGDHTNAVSTALRIEKAFRERKWWWMEDEFSALSFGADFSMAVTMGKARSEGTVLGPCVNLAARIMCNPKCEGAALCDEEVANACGATVTFEDIGFITAKEILNFRIEKTDSESVAIAGREEEMGRLSTTFRNWMAGERGFIVVSGKSGFGKTQLVKSFLKIKGAAREHINSSNYVYQEILLSLYKHLAQRGWTGSRIR
ncbi:Adenylate cyclase type 10 [Phlyctochytrium planicorne]|nr:Adenylate cyclase type 10 [Phlyctochytrium planicorne]